MLFQTVSTFLRFSLIPTPSPTRPASTAGNTRTWHVSDDKQEQFLTDALYMLDVRVRVYKKIPPSVFPSPPSSRYASCPVSTSEFEFELCLVEKFKQQAGGLNSDP